MADMLATPDELALLMRDTGLSEEAATLLLELATGEVQAAAGQRLVLVEDDEFTDLLGSTDAWLVLPQRPVIEVASLTIDDGDELVAGTDYKRFGARLWRRCGWATCWTEPSTIAGQYSHGWEVGDQHLQPARSCTLGLAKGAAANTSGVLSEAIDDYRVQFANSLAELMESADYLRKSLRRTYGARAGMTRIA